MKNDYPFSVGFPQIPRSGIGINPITSSIMPKGVQGRILTPRELAIELERRKNEKRKLAEKLLEEKAERDKKLLHEALSEEAAFSITYVPFVIAEVAWDYVDSILNIAAYMRVRETKPLCRKMKELRRDYDRERYKIINDEWRKSETENMILFQETLSDYFNKLHRFVVDELHEEFGQVDDDSAYLLIATYACRIVLKALKRYCDAQEKIVSAIVGYSVAGTILPKELKTLETLVIEFAGDLELDSKKIANKEFEFVEELAKHIADTELNDTDNSNNNPQTKRMTMEEMTSLVADINATLEVFKTNLELNVTKGNKAAGVRARKASLKLEKLMKTYRKESVK